VDAVTEARIEHQGRSYPCRVGVGAKEKWAKEISLRCSLSAPERQDGETYRLELWMTYQSEGQACCTEGCRGMTRGYARSKVHLWLRPSPGWVARYGGLV